MEQTIEATMQFHLDNLTKPKGSLGDLESMAMKLADIQKTVPPRIGRSLSIVFAADHGVTEEGVSLYPKEVTEQMVRNILSGGAAINVLSRHCGSGLWVVDAGVCGDSIGGDVIDMKVGPGTRNFAREEAMTEAQLQACLQRGGTLAEKVANEGYTLVSLGDMGIGNTTTAAALLAANGLEVERVVDRGTGIDEAMLEHKRSVVSDAVRNHGPFATVLDSMRRVGGFEICMISGFVLGLKNRGVACVIDGFPVTAGAFCAWCMDASVAAYLFAGHNAKVKGHAVTLERMGLKPILDLNMRLGEGTGAVLGGFLVNAAARIACEMASFEGAGVSRSDDDETDY